MLVHHYHFRVDCSITNDVYLSSSTTSTYSTFIVMDYIHGYGEIVSKIAESYIHPSTWRKLVKSVSK